MDEKAIERILIDFREKRITLKEVLEKLKGISFESLGYARIDHHRELRLGIPEIIFCQGKLPEQILHIAKEILQKGSPLLATRADSRTYEKIKDHFPEAEYNRIARTIVVKTSNYKVKKLKGNVLILSAGTSDIPVAEEAAVTIDFLRGQAKKIYDVGVAGIHRLMAYRSQIEEADVIIVVAGMEGALASVVAGLVSKPVIAVPTSVGYGASFQGIGPLLGMLNSCAAGVMVVNIDNGFGAGFAAVLILKAAEKLSKG
ncbi:MAG: nickel pincer cofactor biosynthesis protein LarB [Fidelibacterota bacterium]